MEAVNKRMLFEGASLIARSSASVFRSSMDCTVQLRSEIGKRCRKTLLGDIETLECFRTCRVRGGVMVVRLIVHFHSRSLCCLTQGEVGCWFFCVCCRDPGDCLFLVCSFAILATVFPLCLCGLAASVSRKVCWLGMGGDGFQTQEEVLGVGTCQGGKSSGRCD